MELWAGHEYVDWRTRAAMQMVQDWLMEFRLANRRIRIFSWATLRVAGWVVLFCCESGLAGCGEIAFKRGSGPDAFAADRRACQARNADPASIDACLAQFGWHVTDMDAGAAPASPAPMPPPQTPPATPPAATAPNASPQPVAPAPNLIFGGWWKLGTGAADLHQDADACVAKLGPANVPDPGYHSVTPALYACLRAAGWHGLRRAL
jgi:hypothetical protein